MISLKRVVERILNKHNYYKATAPIGSQLTEAEIVELYNTYGENRTYRLHLRDLCDKDKDLYYIATNDRERDMIRGATQRTKYFLALINKANESAEKKRGVSDSTKVNKVEGVQYKRKVK